MGNNIELLQMSAKLPGYLFVLSKIADINETIYLQCKTEQEGFYKSMLELIGLNVLQKSPALEENFIPRYALIICNAIEDLERIKEINIKDIALVILLPGQMPHDRDCLIGIAQQYLSSRHKWIMISETFNSVQKKLFILCYLKKEMA